MALSPAAIAAPLATLLALSDCGGLCSAGGEAAVRVSLADAAGRAIDDADVSCSLAGGAAEMAWRSAVGRYDCGRVAGTYEVVIRRGGVELDRFTVVVEPANAGACAGVMSRWLPVTLDADAGPTDAGAIDAAP